MIFMHPKLVSLLGFIQKLLYAQLFLTLLSWPILLWWGLPLSWLTLLGNLIFNPCIMVFLLFSICLFFSELVGLPSGIWVVLLEHTVALWLWFVGWGSGLALMAFPCPSGWVLIAIPLATLLIAYKFQTSRHKRLLVMALFFAGLAFYLKLACMPAPGSYLLPGGKSGLVFQFDGTRVILVDELGVLRNGAGLPKWVDFTLRPFLAKKFGRLAVDGIVVKHPTQARLKAADVIAKRLG